MLPHALLQRGMTLAVAGLGAGSATAGGHTQLGEAEALQRCATAMAEVAQIQQHAHMDDTVKARQRLTAQAEHFFRRLPPSLGVSMLTAGPEHLVWFAQEEFSKQNAGEQLVPDQLGVGWDHAIGMPLACSARGHLGRPASTRLQRYHADAADPPRSVLPGACRHCDA